jgi:glycosyltransferase involved in cell wall biosynthesis
MTEETALFDAVEAAPGHASPVRHAPTLRSGLRVVLMQTQAEGAGAQEISRILGRGLTARGYEVHSIFFFRRTAAFDQVPNTFFCALQRPSGVLALVRMFMALIRHLRELRPDVVLCFQHYGTIVGTLAAHLAGGHAIVANRTSAKSLIPPWTQTIDLAFGLSGLCRKVVVNSVSVEHEYGRYPRRYRDRVVRIDHGFEPKTTALTRREARKLLGLPIDATLLGSVARLHPGKNLTAAIRLLVGRDWHLALAGQGAERTELVAFATSLGVADRVHFVGELPPDRIGAFLRSLDIFVFPTLFETFGLAAVEAAEAGVPVVANDLDVLRETLTVDAGPCAVFVDVGDTKAFAAAVQRLLDDRDLVAALRSRSTQLSRRYSLDSMVERYAGLIEAVALRCKSQAPVKS